MFVQQYDEQELVEAYLRFNSQIKAATEMGCSRETVARAVRKANIPLTGRHNNGKHQSGGNNCKITDDEIIAEAGTGSVYEIAERHNMSAERLYRRARKLGVKLKCGGGYWSWKTRADFHGVEEYDKSISLEGVIERDKGICQICGRAVDRTAKKGRHVLKEYPTVDHIIPLSKGGPHTWDNVRLAHMACNAGKCDRYA